MSQGVREGIERVRREVGMNNFGTYRIFGFHFLNPRMNGELSLPRRICQKTPSMPCERGEVVR
jgi:hypothetical protein